MRKQISKTKIENRMRQKSNPILIDLIVKLKKTNPEIAKILSMPRKKQTVFNLIDIDKNVSDGDVILIPGKILSSGELTKKIKIVCYNISESAIEKIKKSKSEFVYLCDEIKTNKELKGVKILK